MMTPWQVTTPWQDPRTGIWTLRKRIPARLRAVAGKTSEIVRIRLGISDRAEAKRRRPEAMTK